MAEIKETAAQQSNVVDKLYMENTLLRVTGALFCHDAKRAPTRVQEIELNRGVQDKRIVIRPDPRLGQPGPLAHKLFIAILKKHSNYGRPIRSEVSFRKRELMRLIGRSDWGGRDSEQLTRALDEIHYTFVRTSFKGADRKYIEHSFNVFPEVYLERDDSSAGPIETCVVSLARPIIASLQEDHFTCLNYLLIQQLGTIGQALYMRLFFHFSNLYDGHHRQRLTFPKRYEAICAEWLGGLKVLKYPSIIEREQLGPHLRKLVQLGFLASYRISKAAQGNGLILTFRPGERFFQDYDRYYRNRHQADFQFDFHDDQQHISEPLKVAYLFVQKRTGRTPSGVSTKEKDTAKQLLNEIPMGEMAAFFEYAFAQASRTKFDPQSLGGLRQYIPAYLQARDRQARARAAEAAKASRDRQEATESAYARFRASRASAVLRALPSGEQAVIDGLAKARAATLRSKNPGFAAAMLENVRIHITAERHPDKIPTFESWAATQA
jgi:hypothetical protein